MFAIGTVNMPRLAVSCMVVAVIVPLLIGVVMGVTMRMVVAAAARVAVRMVVVRIEQRRSELALERNRHVARAIFIFDQQRHNLRADAQIIDRTKIMPAQAALTIEQQNRWRAL